MAEKLLKTKLNQTQIQLLKTDIVGSAFKSRPRGYKT